MISVMAGATGDSKAYIPYLSEIGAAQTDEDGHTVSDEVTGTMSWCSLNSSEEPNAVYEWNVGQFYTVGSRKKQRWTSQLSKDLADRYADYINGLKLKSDGTVLSLQKSEDGSYLSGKYYDYLLNQIQKSLNQFLKDTKFPYSERQGDSEVTYETPREYVKKLNKEKEWLKYNEKSNSVKVLNLEGFIVSSRKPSKEVGAADGFQKEQTENRLFGTQQQVKTHFDETTARLVRMNADVYRKYSGWKHEYVSAYTEDFHQTDKVGNPVSVRQKLYQPLYFLNTSYHEYGSSKIAKYWRIRTGMNQGKTMLSEEYNLNLILQNKKEIKNLDFAAIWGAGFQQVEKSGDSTENVIKWIGNCLK